MSHTLATVSALEAALTQKLRPTLLEVTDESASHAGHAGANGLGKGTHFRVRIASHCFEQQSRLACHRLVYDALQEFLDQGLHALAIEVVLSPS
jgi:BolA protein